MEHERFERTPRAGWAARLVAAAVFMTGAASAWAGTDSGTFRVGLRITASCQIDSSPVTDAGVPSEVAPPTVDCGLSTPSSIRVSREADLPVQTRSEALEAGAAVVVTLSF